MRYVATHPDIAEPVSVDTECADSARGAAAERFAELLGMATAEVHRHVQVSGG
ncbi:MULTISPECIES: hypothetical protein [Mycolicibacterium]|jgi:hypothetical protein|uniref:Helicase, RecD/TraA family n=1 Tax=Mycolicibacterium canariasense TaxID=228230 RepID=A0A100WCF9_MYCCR|nr:MULTISPECIES: hypothetical protein [Mycolicibacterium]MCC9184543.1 hypothetical protein [Mycolicibacterium mageritense]MCV7212757.1 hypothetical protein [Mycolicibacterium canariasense]GAS95681.1 helicase, RecD/TraA family [Mycolicibacterium canariasense]